MAHPSRRLALTATAGALAVPALIGARPTPPAEPPFARRAHAHNDYEHPRPLHDALDHGFASVEADIWLMGGQLLVAHDEIDLDPARTLQSLYLDPLAARIRANGGSVYRSAPRQSLQLLIDLKTAGEPTYRALSRALRPYRSILGSATAAGRVRRGAVTAVVSGDRAARAPMEAEAVRWAFYDGRTEDLGGPAPASFMPLISGNWNTFFRWQGTGPIPAAERAALHDLTARAHAAGQTVRFWATPDAPGPARDAVWGELLAAGADWINTDDLPGLAAFLRTHDAVSGGR
ncbi:phosphatidylinositol-specific phospholipase C/glycerophosphodiester phosphodiesterase family protein [Streptomyces xiamenensis]